MIKSRSHAREKVFVQYLLSVLRGYSPHEGFYILSDLRYAVASMCRFKIIPTSRFIFILVQVVFAF
jgi:hypothetical protein